MQSAGCVLGLLLLSGGVTADGSIDLDVTLQDIDRALTIARSTDAERARFHAPYILTIDDPFVERIEIISEFRRVVLLAEEHAARGDRAFTYSTTLAQKAVEPWKHRVAIAARLRFHPLNAYVDVPPAEIVLDANPSSRIGVLTQPILALPSARSGDRLPLLGAVVEGVFDALAVGQGTHEFTIRLDGKELRRVPLALAALQ
jgi:hypothetical protein